MKNNAAHRPFKIGKSPQNRQKWYQCSLLGGTLELWLFYTNLLNFQNKISKKFLKNLKMPPYRRSRNRAKIASARFLDLL